MKQNLITIDCSIGELFAAIEQLYNTKINITQSCVIEPNTLQIQNENDVWCDIGSLTKKQDVIVTLHTNNDIIKAAASHIIITDKRNLFSEIRMDEIQCGQKILKNDLSEETVQQITTSLKPQEVFDLEIKSPNHWYKTSNGFVHHNSVGIGKSFAVVDELQKEGVPFTHITGGIKDAQALYVTLCKYNDPKMIIVFDDVNDIIRKKLNVEILRGAVTNEPIRHITYFDQTMLIIQGTKSFKPTLDFQSKVILITNIPKHKIDPAIVSRTSPIEIIVSPPEIAPYIEDNLENAPPVKVPIEWKHEAWHYITKEIGVNKVKRLDFRVFEDVMLWVCASKDSDAMSTDWKKYAYSILM